MPTTPLRSSCQCLCSLGQLYLIVELGRPLEHFVELLQLWCHSLWECLLYFHFQVFAKASPQFKVHVLEWQGA